MLSSCRTLAGLGYAEENVINFGGEDTAKRSNATFVDGSLLWQLELSEDITKDGRCEKGLRSASISKNTLQLEPNTFALPATYISEFADVIMVQGKRPLVEISYGYYLHPKGRKQGFGDNTKNTAQCIIGSNSLLLNSRRILKR